MSRVAVLCPSRNNPEGLHRLRCSVRDTSKAIVLAYVDDDQRAHYPALWDDRSLTIHSGPRVGPVAAANQLAKAYQDFDAYGLLPDDATMLVEGWDAWVLAALAKCPGGIGVVAPYHNLGGMVDMPFVSRRWIELTGWYACPDFYHWCWPTVTALIGEMTAIVHAPQVAFSVWHEPGPHLSNPERRNDDNRKFFEFVSLKLPEYVDRMRAAMYPSAAEVT